MSIGDRVLYLREKRELSQAELARRIGIAAPSLSLIETGKTRALRGNTLDRLCEELRTTPDFLLRGTEGPDGLELARMEAELTYTIRTLSHEARIALMEYARYLLSKQPGAQPARAVAVGTVTPIKRRRRPPQ